MIPERSIFTIGHSTHAFEAFAALLARHGVTAVADVRSHPYSRLAHFHRPALEARLPAAGVQYVFLGRELGARRDEPECYVDGQADYRRIAALPAFAAGLERLERGARTHRIALMCAEKEPLDCHRTILVSRQLALRGWNVRHILADGSLETQADCDRRLLRLTGVARTLFDAGLDDARLIERAYDVRAAQIGYRVPAV